MFFATHASILTSARSTTSLRSGFYADGTLPYRLPSRTDSAASVAGLSPVIFSAQDHLTSELLRTL